MISLIAKLQKENEQLLDNEKQDLYKIQQLEKENAELRKQVDGNLEYIDQLKNKLKGYREPKTLNRQKVEKIFDKYIEYDDKTLGDGEEIYWREIKIYNEDIDKLITAICNLALKIDRDKITAILVGKILESNKDAVVIADEIISAIGGQHPKSN